jgi:hypothetical protein
MVECRTNVLPIKLMYVTDANEDEVAEVDGDVDVIKGILLIALFALSPRFVYGPVSIVLIHAKAKLQIIGKELSFSDKVMAENDRESIGVCCAGWIVTPWASICLWEGIR